jgi:hypothetical protein
MPGAADSAAKNCEGCERAYTRHQARVRFPESSVRRIFVRRCEKCLNVNSMKCIIAFKQRGSCVSFVRQLRRAANSRALRLAVVGGHREA